MARQMPSTRPKLIEELRASLQAHSEGSAIQKNIAWAEFFRLYQQAIVGIGRRRRLSLADCDDLVQEVSNDLRRYLPGFEYDPRRGKFRSWLTRICLSKVADIKRREKRQDRERQAPSSSLARNNVIDPKAVTPHDDLVARQSMESFVEALAELAQGISDRDVHLFEATQLERRPIVEVAHELGMQAASARQALRRIKLKLIRTLRDRGFGEG